MATNTRCKFHSQYSVKNYYARVRVKGKLIWKSLKTDGWATMASHPLQTSRNLKSGCAVGQA